MEEHNNNCINWDLLHYRAEFKTKLHCIGCVEFVVVFGFADIITHTGMTVKRRTVRLRIKTQFIRLGERNVRSKTRLALNGFPKGRENRIVISGVIFTFCPVPA